MLRLRERGAIRGEQCVSVAPYFGDTNLRLRERMSPHAIAGIGGQQLLIQSDRGAELFESARVIAASEEQVADILVGLLQLAQPGKARRMTRDVRAAELLRGPKRSQRTGNVATRLETAADPELKPCDLELQPVVVAIGRQQPLIHGDRLSSRLNAASDSALFVERVGDVPVTAGQSELPLSLVRLPVGDAFQDRRGFAIDLERARGVSLRPQNVPDLFEADGNRVLEIKVRRIDRRKTRHDRLCSTQELHACRRRSFPVKRFVQRELDPARDHRRSPCAIQRVQTQVPLLGRQLRLQQ
ncbi:MAG TPA: hypothetical protein VE974_23415 [Thermoanaerobaculia bacterium]|nr:hypothetical protein [Thermoanaerobaculia bacterium]